MPYLRMVVISFLVSSWIVADRAHAQTTTIFQSRVATGITNTPTRSCYIRTAGSTSSTSAWVTEDATLSARNPQGYPLVDFPFIIGTGAGQIPPGANIISAKLKLYCTAVNGSTSTTRTIFARPIFDWDRLGTWWEPEATTIQGLYSGANWVRRDGRQHIDRPWDLSGSLQPTTANLYPSILQAISGLQPSIVVDISTSAPSSTYQAGEFHSWEVGPAVQLWAAGVSNQGFLIDNLVSAEVIYASDDTTTSSQRPRLEVTWTPTGGPLYNRLPIAGTATPSQPATSIGRDVAIILNATDPDGPMPEFVVLEQPLNGTLIGQPPYLTYRPHPSFTGSDGFSWAARDFLGITYPQRVTVNVNAAPGTAVTFLQEGVTPMTNPAASQTRSTGVRISSSSSAQATFEDTTFRVFQPTASTTGRQGFLDFPGLIGNGSGQVPTGSIILQARLEMKVETISAAGGEDRVISLHRIIDPLARGSSWREPDEGIVAPESAGCSGCGVTWLHPDSAAVSQPWHIPGGDIHPGDVTGFRITPEDSPGSVKIIDVTTSVRAWAAGAPNYGWTIRSSSFNSTAFHSDDALSGQDRPRLVVTYRPPASGPVAGTIAPQADAGADQEVVANQTVFLDGRGSFHANGAFFATYWFQIGGPAVSLSNADLQTPSFVAPQVAIGQIADVQFMLAAFTDPAHFTLDTVSIKVTSQPGGTTYNSPVISAGADFSTTELSPTTLTGNAQAAPSATISFRWTQLSGPFAPLQNAHTSSATFLAPSVGPGGGVMVFDLEVTQTIGGWTSSLHDEISVIVLNDPNTPPQVDPGPSRNVEPETWFTLDGSATTDAEGHLLTYSWSQLSGPNVNVGMYQPQGTAGAVTTPIFIPTATSITPMVFRLSVSDGELTSTANVTLTIVPPPPSFSGSLTVNPMSPYRDALTDSEARHILRRMGAGWHPDDVAAVRAMGLSATVGNMMSIATPASIKVEALDYSSDIATPANANPPLNQPFDPYPQYTIQQIEAFWYTFAFRNPAALQERLVQFFHGRLACAARSLSVGKKHWAIMYSDMLRTHATGNYRDLLLAFSRDALTLAFIDGFENVFVAPNENFGREFMELHTLGLFDEAGNEIYSMMDVQEAARALTGWRPSCLALIPGTQTSCYPSFVPFFHDNGIKTILGFSGNFDDEDFVDLVLQHDNGDDAARWLARGLLEYFVVHDPPQQAIAALAQVILASNWQMAPVMQTMLVSNAMFAPQSRKSIVKSPVELANGAVRTLRVPLQTHDIAAGATTALAGQIRLLNHRLGNPEDVNGFTKDLDWVDEYSSLRRNDLLRRILIFATSPSAPVLGDPGGDIAGYPAIPSSLEKFLPPERARFSSEIVSTLARHLDIRLQSSPTPGATLSEAGLASLYLDSVVQSSGSPPGYTTSNSPFDGNNGADQSKIWGLVLLLMMHPEFAQL